jgi:hypothetical protein
MKAFGKGHYRRMVRSVLESRGVGAWVLYFFVIGISQSGRFALSSRSLQSTAAAYSTQAAGGGKTNSAQGRTGFGGPSETQGGRKNLPAIGQIGVIVLFRNAGFGLPTLGDLALDA